MMRRDSGQTALVKRIQTLLESAEARKFILRMDETAIRQEDDWWYVPVAPGVPNVNAFDYAPILNRIEEQFESEGTKLLLVPFESD